MPDVEQCGAQGEGYRADDDAGDAEEGDSADDGDEDSSGVGSHAGADEDGVEDVVDGADDDATPDGEDGGLAPVAVEAEVEADWSPDKDCADGGDQGEDCGGEGPEDDAGNSRTQ